MDIHIALRQPVDWSFDGKFIVSGSPDEMRDSADPLVRQFVHGLTEGPLTERKRGGAYERDLLHQEAD